jgi:hypothetical protein
MLTIRFLSDKDGAAFAGASMSFPAQNGRSGDLSLCRFTDLVRKGLLQVGFCFYNVINLHLDDHLPLPSGNVSGCLLGSQSPDAPLL